MRRIQTFIILSVICACSFSLVRGQTNSTEAKAAYLLAEEAFEAGRLTECINYLDKASQKLGGPNAKILYLKIFTYRELAKNLDIPMLQKLIESINAFEALPDLSEFSEEKRLEITKLRLKFSAELVEMEKDRYEIFAFQSMRITGWRLGMSADELKAIYPDFFTTNKPVFVGSQVQYSGIYKGVSGISIWLQNDRLVKVDGYFINTPDDENFTKGKAETEKWLVELTDRLSKSKSDTVTSESAKKAMNKIYERSISWNEGRFHIGFHHEGHRRGKEQYNSYGYLSISFASETK